MYVLEEKLPVHDPIESSQQDSEYQKVILFSDFSLVIFFFLGNADVRCFHRGPFLYPYAFVQVVVCRGSVQIRS